jgi:hypothetical protein
MVITEAGADDRVTDLLYVTSLMPDAGQSQAGLIGAEPAPWLQPGEDGTVGVDPDMVRELFLQVHRGSRHPARDTAPAGQSRHATGRVQRRTSPVSLASPRVCRQHRRHDPSRLTTPTGYLTACRV